MDPTRQAIYECIQAAFSDAGLNPVTSPKQIINWPTIPKDVKTQIAVFIRNCILQKLGKDPGDLVAVILAASAQEPAMPVSDLIEINVQMLGA
jgi:hypothetical protein